MGAVFFVAVLSIACGEQGDSASQPVQLQPYASVISPPSRSPGIVLLEGDTACVIDTYWYRVVCTEPTGESSRFGQEGEGPGEFLDPFSILRGPAETIGVIDLQLSRLSVFSVSGEFRNSTSGIPLGFLGGGSPAMGGTLVGPHMKRDAGDLSFVNAEIEAASGRVVWERAFPEEADIVDCSTPTPGPRRRQLTAGYHDRRGGLLFVACYGEFLVWYADRDADEPAAIVRSTYVERYPSDEDVAAALEMLNSLPAGGFRPSLDEEQIRARPMVWYGARVVDDQRRFWAVSHWNAGDVIPDLSYIDMYRLADSGPEFALTLRVSDKVVGMDVLGNTLAVLVERDTGGVISEHRVDWFDVTDVTAESRPSPMTATVSRRGVVATPRRACKVGRSRGIQYTRVRLVGSGLGRCLDDQDSRGFAGRRHAGRGGGRQRRTRREGCRPVHEWRRPR